MKIAGAEGRRRGGRAGQGRRAPAAQGRGGGAAAAQGQWRRAVAAQGHGTGGAREQAVLTGGGGDGAGEKPNEIQKPESVVKKDKTAGRRDLPLVEGCRASTAPCRTASPPRTRSA